MDEPTDGCADRDRHPVGGVGSLPGGEFSVKVSDEAAWQGQLAEFARDGDPNAAALQTFLTAWAENAERLHEENLNESATVATQQLLGSREGDTVALPSLMAPMELLRATLRSTETQLGGIERISIGFIGMALTLLSMYWDYGESIYDDMTPIEQHLVEDTALVKLVQLTQQAQESGNERPTS